MPASPPPTTTLSEADVRKVARLARLALSDAEVSQHRTGLVAVIGLMDTLKALDLSGVDAPGAALHAGGAGAGGGGDGSGSHLATDEVGPALPTGVLMAMSPQSMPPFVRVPRVFDDGGGA